LPEALDAFERQLLQQALKRCNTTYELADYLGISQPTVFRRLRKYGWQVRTGQYAGVLGRKKPGPKAVCPAPCRSGNDRVVKQGVLPFAYKTAPF
jgi:hypothetical protein